MSTSIFILLLVQIILIILNAIFASAEIAVLSIDTIAVILITLVLSYFTLIFGELVPKRIAMKKSEELAMGISGLVTGISILFKPIVTFLSISTNIVLKICGINPNEAEEQVGEEDIRMLVDAGSEKGTIDHQEKEFIQNVFEFNDIMAGTIATHRTDVTILWMADDVQDWDETIHNTRHTLYPVCGDSIDHVIGILNAKDYFRLKEKNKNMVINSAISAPYFVMETTKADVLFKNMKQLKQSMAIVLDEYGGMVGIVTLFDLLEEIVGDLNDIESISLEEETAIIRISDNKWEVKGNIRLGDIENDIGITLTSEDCDTFTLLITIILPLFTEKVMYNRIIYKKNFPFIRNGYNR